MEQIFYYQTYSSFLNRKYGEKVYKLPINLPITCPNRIHGTGCSFCADAGTGFEAASSEKSVTEQLTGTKELITRKYKAKKYIAYFQNYTNTYMPLDHFESYILEAARFPDIVEISISTRPDCILDSYLEKLHKVSSSHGLPVTIELGLQTVNYHTLDRINRGHGLAEYIDAVLMIRKYGFTVCTHVILNLPGDTIRDVIETAKILSALKSNIVKVHSLYIAKNTILCNEYENGTIELCTKDEYLKRLVTFLEFLDPSIIVERLFSRIPEADAVFSNWGTSWWKLQDELLALMDKTGSYQGKAFGYLNGAAMGAYADSTTYK